MVKGRYELKLQMDIENKVPQKELKMSGLFEDSVGFIRSLMLDLKDVAPLINKYIPEGETNDAEVRV